MKSCELAAISIAVRREPDLVAEERAAGDLLGLAAELCRDSHRNRHRRSSPCRRTTPARAARPSRSPPSVESGEKATESTLPLRLVERPDDSAGVVDRLDAPARGRDGDTRSVRRERDAVDTPTPSTTTTGGVDEVTPRRCPTAEPTPKKSTVVTVFPSGATATSTSVVPGSPSVVNTVPVADPTRRSCRPGAPSRSRATADGEHRLHRRLGRQIDRQQLLSRRAPQRRRRSVGGEHAVVRPERPPRLPATVDERDRARERCRWRRPRSRRAPRTGRARDAVTTPTYLPLGDATASDALTPSTPGRSTNVDPSARRHRDPRAVGAPDGYDDPRAVRRDRSRTEWPFARSRPAPTAPNRRSARGSIDAAVLTTTAEPFGMNSRPATGPSAVNGAPTACPVVRSQTVTVPDDSPAIASSRPSALIAMRANRSVKSPPIWAAVPSSPYSESCDRRHDGRAFPDRVVAGEHRPTRPPACERARRRTPVGAGAGRRRRPTGGRDGGDDGVVHHVGGVRVRRRGAAGDRAAMHDRDQHRGRGADRTTVNVPTRHASRPSPRAIPTRGARRPRRLQL